MHGTPEIVFPDKLIKDKKSTLVLLDFIILFISENNDVDPHDNLSRPGLLQICQSRGS